MLRGLLPLCDQMSQPLTNSEQLATVCFEQHLGTDPPNLRLEVRDLPLGLMHTRCEPGLQFTGPLINLVAPFGHPGQRLGVCSSAGFSGKGGLPQLSAVTNLPPQQLAPVPQFVEHILRVGDGQLRRRRWCRGPNIGDQIRDADVSFVPNSTDNGDFAREDRAGNGFIVEGGKVLSRPTAAPDNEHIQATKLL